ncbi:CPBP family intramembrane glutamic endopeptidase [Saccharopolyspora shandongensis]|uniref:CPBP family intramembrane glutamic endopeptidase n=1 Tax=Saccharopolyspora shandongensis TaxID=418495 RepID=UPI0033FF9A90
MTTSQLSRSADRPKTSRRQGVLAFVLLTFGISWASMFAAALPGFSLANPLAQLPAAMGPAVAAIIVRRWVTREGFGDAGLRLRLRGNWHHYLAAWLVPYALAAGALAIAAATGLWQPDELPAWWLIPVLLLVVPVLTPLYWGEEFGWTSYLRLRVCPGRPQLATAVTGLVWAVWHYPLAFLGYIEFDNVLIGLPLWTVSFYFQEVVLSWLRIRSGTIWTASLAHGGNNLVLSLLTGLALEGSVGAEVTTVVMTVPIALLGGWILVSGRLRPAEPGL